MKRFLLTLLATICCAMCVQAADLLSAPEGYKVTLSKEGGAAVTKATRDDQLFLHGPICNATDEDLMLRFAIMLENKETGERFIKTRKEETWEDHLSLMWISFSPNYMLENGIYKVVPVYQTTDKDENVLDDWRKVAVPAGFTVPTIEITGDEPIAYLPVAPYVNNQKNLAEVDLSELHVRLTALADMNNVDLLAFVFNEGGELSIGRYKVGVNLKEGESEDFVLKYMPDRSPEDDLAEGKTYVVSFILRENYNRKPLMTGNYDNFKFKVVGHGLDVITVEAAPAETVMKVLRDGKMLIVKDGVTYDMGGRPVK